MYDITIEKAEIWNVRLKHLIRINGYNSQESFAEALRKHYETKFSQRVISRWTRVGEKISTKNGSTLIGFPDFINMLLIADFFDVDIGYLVGETDEDTFELEKACSYLGLSGEAIKAIRKITNPDNQQSEMLKEMRDALNNFISATGFNDFVGSLFDLHQTSLSPQRMDTRSAICINYIIDFFRNVDYQGKVERYELNEALVLLINEIYPKPSSENLPNGYGECDVCLSASPNSEQNDSEFFCPLKK